MGRGEDPAGRRGWTKGAGGFRGRRSAPVGVWASRPRRKARPPCCAGPAAMPFLHGFRRIIFEYQPLVDAILGSLGIQDPERQESLDR